MSTFVFPVILFPISAPIRAATNAPIGSPIPIVATPSTNFTVPAPIAPVTSEAKITRGPAPMA